MFVALTYRGHCHELHTQKLLYLVEIGDYDGIKKLLEEGNMDVDVRDPSRKVQKEGQLE